MVRKNAHENQQQNPANTHFRCDVIYNVELIMPICIHINKTELFSRVGNVVWPFLSDLILLLRILVLSKD